MRHRLPSLAVVGTWLLFGGLPGLAQDTEPPPEEKTAAWIVSLEGDVTVRREGHDRTAVSSQSWRLRHGDKVRVGASSKVVIAYASGLFQEYRRGPEPGHQEIEIGQPAEEQASGVSRMWAVLRSFFEKPTPEAPGASMGVDKSDPPVLLHPRAGRVLSPRPEVAWMAPADDKSTFQVCLKRDSGKRPTPTCEAPQRIWEVEGTGAEVEAHSDRLAVFTLSYPTGQPSLSVGETYRLGVRRDSETEYTYWGRFTVAAEPYLVEAAFLLEQQRYAAALRVLRQAREREPANPAVAHLLAWLYNEVGPPFLIAELEEEPDEPEEEPE